MTPPDESCETNPIGSEAKEREVIDEKGVMSDLMQNGLERPKPVFAENGPYRCLVAPVGTGEAPAAG
jgi:hypothetical protein